MVHVFQLFNQIADVKCRVTCSKVLSLLCEQFSCHAFIYIAFNLQYCGERFVLNKSYPSAILL